MCTCSEGVTRRQAMQAVAAMAAAFAAGTLPLGWARAADGKKQKVLFFTKSAGFQHSVITRGKNGELGHAETILIELGTEHGFDVTATKDGSVFTPDKLKEFDVIAFYTTGDLTTPGADKSTPMPKEGKQALFDHIRSGKGFVGFHCASDTFHSQGNNVDPYIKMVGGEFKSHGAQQSSKISVAKGTKFPIKDLQPFEMTEEWYQLINFNPDMHVILVQETASMREESYKKLTNYPMTWARKEGQGRVFYTSMGHREDVWTNPLFQSVLLGGLAWAAGNVQADVPSNFNEATPEAKDRAIKSDQA
jgi:type 1 glutamine amidotransferase